MNIKSHFSFLTLLLMISFATVNAVLFTPALPEIAKYFNISASTAQLTITWFLIGYAIGQLIYGPIANRFGRKPALYTGIILQIVSSLMCVVAGMFHAYSMLVLGRFLLALGSGVGRKMTFTLVNETYEPMHANQTLSYLMIAFAIMPGLAVMIGGFLSTHFHWTSTFYAGAIYGVILLLLTRTLPETKKHLDYDAFRLRHLGNGYFIQFKNYRLIMGSLLMGCSTSFIYIFAALAPFIAINFMNMTESSYGTANLLPPIGIILGSFLSAQLIKKYQPIFMIKTGILITLIASIMMLMVLLIKSSPLGLFLPMTLCQLGLSLVFPNASIIAMNKISDKAHASSVMNFISLGLVAIVVLNIGLLPMTYFMLPIVYIGIGCIMWFISRFINDGSLGYSSKISSMTLKPE